MNDVELLSRVDHTLLKAISTWEEITILCKEAIEYHMASVCIPPSYVKRVSELFGEKLNICTVIGFPLGYNTTETKIYEIEHAIQDGASEVDLVVNLGEVKNGEFDKVLYEILEARKAAGSKILKVIIETCYLTQEEKIQLCRCVTESGADYIKTSTGFGTKGADLADIELFKENIGPDVKIKASGGIRTREEFYKFAEAGCDRIGASAAVKALGNK